jgi:hypothetical protein
MNETNELERVFDQLLPRLGSVEFLAPDLIAQQSEIEAAQGFENGCKAEVEAGEETVVFSQKSHPPRVRSASASGSPSSGSASGCRVAWIEG